MKRYECIINGFRNLCPHETINGKLCSQCKLPDAVRVNPRKQTPESNVSPAIDRFELPVLTKDDFYKYYTENSPGFSNLSMDRQGEVVEAAWKVYERNYKK